MSLAGILEYIGEQNALSGVQKFAQDNFGDNPVMLSLAQNDPRAFRSLLPDIIKSKQQASALAALTQPQTERQVYAGSVGDLSPESGIPQSLPTEGPAQRQEKALSRIPQLSQDQLTNLYKVNPQAATEYIMRQYDPSTQIEMEKAYLEADKLRNPEKYSMEMIKSKQEMLPALTTFVNSAESIKADLDKLDEMRAIPSTKRNALSNAMSYIANTEYAGDTTGRMVGTEAQEISDRIQTKIPIMKQQIMGITGMSAKQMDSNVEMQNFMKAFGSQTSSYEARKAALDNLLDFADTYAKQRLGASIRGEEEQTKSLRSNSQPTVTAAAPGRIYVNPTTSERIQKVNGKWVPVQ